jgi:predicted acetyltransferase
VVTQTLLPTGLAFRSVAADQMRGSYDLFRAAVHDAPASDEHWDVMTRAHVVDRTFGAFDGDRQIGTATSFPASLTVPGGAILPMAAVTFVGVRTDYRRRGALSGMMRVQLADLAARGDVFAGLHASEPVIYERFGYGVGTVGRTIKMINRRAAMRPDVPVAGTVRLLDKDEVVPALQAAYPRFQATRAGLMGRSPQWWALAYERRLTTGYLLVAGHFDAAGTLDGWVAYRPEEDTSDDPRAGSGLRVLDFQSADQSVANDLWRYLIGVDLIEDTIVYYRPPDDPVEATLVNAHAVRSEADDELWLRIVDVPAALAARAYGVAAPVVIEVVDTLLPANSGRYRVGPHATGRTSEPAALTMAVETLAMLYLGTWRASALAAIGRVTVADPSALVAMDRLFAVDQPAWSGTLF